MAWSSPRTWVAAETVTAAFMNAHVRDNLLHIAGTSGFTGTPGATRGIEPASGYFMGGVSQNRHTESGYNEGVGAAGSVSPTFVNAFASNPSVVTATSAASSHARVSAFSTSGCTIVNDSGDSATLFWHAEGAD